MEAKKLQVDHRTPIEIVRHLDIPVPRKIYGRRFTLYPPLAAEQVDTIPWREATQSGELCTDDHRVFAGTRNIYASGVVWY
jgi:hypothetical protein